MELVVTKRTTEDMELVAPKARKLLITAPGRKAGAEGYGAGGNDNNYGVYGAGGAKGYEAGGAYCTRPSSWDCTDGYGVGGNNKSYGGGGAKGNEAGGDNRNRP